VSLGNRSYDILIAPNLLEDLPAKVERFAKKKRVLLITDSNVEELYADKVAAALKRVCSAVETSVFPAGEESKTLATVSKLYGEAVEAKLDRSSIVVALGGGVVGDIAGFMAATFMRGIPFIQIPTTLLAMVDSSVGGKTGVDIPEGKNLVGAFHQPLTVLIDPNTLSTLPKREFRGGLGEVVKYGMILDEEFFKLLEDNVEKINALDPEFMTNAIAICCELKARVVTEDELDLSGRRAILNYGHTFAHAIETATGYAKTTHGEAVGIGMCMAANLAVADGRLDDAAELRQENLLRALRVPCEISDIAPSKIYSAMSSDKKAVAGEARFVLPETIGAVELTDGPMGKAMVMDAIRSCCD
jgi:3-dehydroquinate synthase